MSDKVRPNVLIILDGWGFAPASDSNAISLAKTPVMDSLGERCPHTHLEASGQAVGLLEGQVGNSEAGHMNIGAGRVVLQDVSIIHEAIGSGTFFKNPGFDHAYQNIRHEQTNLHLMGLLSDEHSGHSNPLHLRALLKFYRQKKVKNIYLHLFTDGRDTPPHAGLGLLRKLESELQPHERVATIAGRFYLDRRKRWDRTEKIYNCLVRGEGLNTATAEVAIREAYDRGETDEFIIPTVISDSSGQALPRMSDGDSIIFFNLRSDRSRQLTKPFVQKNFDRLNKNSFKRKKILEHIAFIAMTDFGPDLGDILTAFPSADINKTLPWVLKNKKQIYIAESEKFAQVTYFFNGGWTDPVGKEERLKVETPRVAHFDERPEMAAIELTDAVVKKIMSKKYNFITLNFANADMVAHTGNLSATMQACAVVDKSIARIKDAIDKTKGVLFITADHGNAEELRAADGQGIDTEHNGNPVPFIIYDGQHTRLKDIQLQPGVLGDIAPTILEIMKISQPKEMTGKSLIKIAT